MGMKKFYKVLIFLKIVCCVFGCSCEYSHLQTQFCNADFAFRGEWIRENQQEHRIERSYDYANFRVIEDFKGTLSGNDTVSVNTGFSGGSCTMRFGPRTDYLVLGKEYNGEIAVGSCGGTRTSSSVRPYELAGIRGEYDCSCQIVERVNGNNINDKNTCLGSTIGVHVVTIGQSEDRCRPDYRICSKRVDTERCAWGCEQQ